MANVTLNVNTRAPQWWRNISRAARFILGSLIATFSTTDLYEPDISKRIVFWLGVGIIIFTGLDIALGTKQLDEEDTIQVKKSTE